MHDPVAVELRFDQIRNIHVVMKYRRVRDFISGHMSQSIIFEHSLFRIPIHFYLCNRFVNFFHSYRGVRKRVSVSRDLRALEINIDKVYL